MDAPIFNRWSFTVTWVVRIVLVLPIVQLGKHILELLRDGQTDVSSVLQQRQSLISFLLVNFSRRDSVIIESFDTQYSLSNSSGIQKSAQPTDFSVR